MPQLRVTWVLVAEAIVFASLSSLLLSMPRNATVSMTVGGVLAALVLLLLVMIIGQRRTLCPLINAVGVCGACGARSP